MKEINEEILNAGDIGINNEKKPVMILENLSQLSRIATDSVVFDSKFVNPDDVSKIQNETLTQYMSDMSYKKESPESYIRISGIPTTDTKIKICPDAVTNTETGLNSYVAWKKYTDNQVVILDNILKSTSDNKNGIQHKMAKLFKECLEIGMDENYLDYMKEFPYYQQTLNSTMASLPKNLFNTGKLDEKGKPIFKRDDKKYDKLLNDYGLIKILELDLKFLKEETIPYITAKKNGSLTPEQAAEYKNKFLKLFEERSKIAEQIQGINPDDPLFKENETFGFSDTYLLDKRWKKEFSKRKIDDYKHVKTYIDKGWPVQDMSVLDDINKYYNVELSTSKEKNNLNYSKETINNSKQFIKKAQNDYKKLTESDITTTEERSEILSNFKKHFTEIKSEKVAGFIDTAMDTPLSNIELGVVKLRELERNEARAKEELQQAEKPFDINDVPVQIDGNKLIKTVKDIKKSIKDVDYFMWGTSSKQFNEMLESLEDLEKYTEKNVSSSKEISVDELKHLYSRVAVSLQSVNSYLQRKEGQLNENKDRKEDKRKQKHEQPRIQASINAEKKLNDILLGFESGLIAAVKGNVQKELKTKLDNEEKIRSNVNTTDSDYKRSILRSIDLTQKMHDSYYHITSNENFDSFVTRLNNSFRTNYTDAYLKRTVGGSKAVKEIFNSLLHIDPDKKSQRIRRMPDEVKNDIIKKAYNDKIKEVASSVLADNLKLNAGRKKNMISTKQAAKEGPKK